MLTKRTYKYRIYPTQAHIERLEAWSRALRWLWNLALEQRLMAYGRPRIHRKYPSLFDQINELKSLREEAPWLADVPSNVCANKLMRLDIAWQMCFAKTAGQPRWRRKSDGYETLTEPNPRQFKVLNNKIIFPKLREIDAVIHRPIQGTPKTCSITKEVDQWFALIVCDVEIDVTKSDKEPVGLDVGVANLVADSKGRSVAGADIGWFKRLDSKNRRASHHKKSSANRKKAKAVVAKIHRKARRQRDAVLHRESKFYAKNHGTIFVERLDILSMTRSASGTAATPGRNVSQKSGLNRSVRHNAWGRFLRMLAYKSDQFGGSIVEIPAAYSSQTCAECGVVDAASRQSQSKFECVACGHRANADVNAAKVLLSRGIHGEAVCGGSAARERPAKQKLFVARRKAT